MPVSPEAEALRQLANRPLQQRQPIGSQRQFLDGYQPNVSHWLTPAKLTHLKRIGTVASQEAAAGTYARQIINRLLIDL